MPSAPRVLFGLVLLMASCAPSEKDLVVFAAASLSDVAHAAAEFDSTRHVIVTVGATSLLSQQIEHGAPADAFLAAHPRWVDRLVNRGLTSSPPVEIARGRLVVVAPAGTEAVGTAADALAGAMRIALANPSHVPAGEYAQAALEAGGLWGGVEPRVVPVADVRAALVAVQRGAADVAIVYASDALAAPALSVVYRFTDAEAPEIRYVGVAVSDDPEAAAWVRRLGAPGMDPVWRAHGFAP